MPPAKAHGQYYCLSRPSVHTPAIYLSGSPVSTYQHHHSSNSVSIASLILPFKPILTCLKLQGQQTCVTVLHIRRL